MGDKGKRGFFESTIFLKILSVFLALILWFFVAGDSQDALGLEVRRTFDNIPLVMRNIGIDLVVTETAESVTLSLQGVQAAFDGLTPADLEAYVDLINRKEGWHELRINATAPPGVSVVRIEPAKVSIYIDDLISRQMDVKGNFHGEPGRGLIVMESNFEPRYVFVRGPRRKVDLTHQVIFLLDIQGITDDLVAQKVTLFPVDIEMNLVEGVTVVPEEVDVWVSLVMPQKDIPVVAAFLPEGAEVEVLSIEPPLLKLKGPQKLLDSLEQVFTQEIDLNQLEEREGILSEVVSVVIPGQLEAVDQESVRVRFRLAEQTE
ncbi:MAG: CdaR family protein [Bacillota bacterium]